MSSEEDKFGLTVAATAVVVDAVVVGEAAPLPPPILVGPLAAGALPTLRAEKSVPPIEADENEADFPSICSLSLFICA